jgi:hypothetical protein
MRTGRIRKPTRISSLAILAAIAISSFGCSSKTETPGSDGGPHIGMIAAPAGSCQIDAVKF